MPNQREMPTTAPMIPLSPDLRSAYQNLYDNCEDAIEATMDPGLRERLMASKASVEDILTDDDAYGIEENTALYNALLGQIKDSSTELDSLQKQIRAISSGVNTFGDILGAIDKVLSLVPGV